MDDLIEELTQSLLQIEEIKELEDKAKEKVRKTIEIFVKYYGLQKSPALSETRANEKRYMLII
jgi:ribosomal protein L17